MHLYIGNDLKVRAEVSEILKEYGINDDINGTGKGYHKRYPNDVTLCIITDRLHGLHVGGGWGQEAFLRNMIDGGKVYVHYKDFLKDPTIVGGVKPIDKFNVGGVYEHRENGTTVKVMFYMMGRYLRVLCLEDRLNNETNRTKLPTDWYGIDKEGIHIPSCQPPTITTKDVLKEFFGNKGELVKIADSVEEYYYL